MPSKVILTVTQGKLLGKEFWFEERTTCLIGRAKDCQIQLPSDDDHRLVSRYHCLLDINPPDLRVRDLGSRNGTYVNGTKIGQRPVPEAAPEAVGPPWGERDLQEGDELEVGKTIFRIVSLLPKVCVQCAAEIPPEDLVGGEPTAGGARCARCRLLAASTQVWVPSAPMPRLCSWCGRDVSRALGAARPGDFVCAPCQADFLRRLPQAKEQAAAGLPQPATLEEYEILRELGRGGMGVVYQARHRPSSALVALKVMLPQVATDEGARERFLREAQNTMALNHPHVVRLHHAGWSSGSFCLTLEYCDGGTVSQLVKQRGGALAVEEALPIILQALDGLDYAHRADIPYVKQADGSFGPGRGLVHRDLKPSNLLLVGSGTARVARISDYGLAKAFDAAGLSGYTRTGTIGGTPLFMPRQQLINFKYAKPEVDVWSMAATLYYMLTGVPPRTFPKDKDWCEVLLETDAVPIRARNPALPMRLAEVIDRALIESPTIHFQTAADFKRALESVRG